MRFNCKVCYVALYIAIIFGIICYHLLTFLGTNNRPTNIEFDNYLSKNRTYLWRTSSIENVNGSSDRIADQLEWTKIFFESKNIEHMQGKNILLVFGDGVWTFWETENRAICPGFEISANKCNLTLAKNGSEFNLNLKDFDALIYTQDYKMENRRLLQQKLSKNVKHIRYMYESPPNAPGKIGANDILASYHRNSDIAIPYAKWVSFEDEKFRHFNFNLTHKKFNSSPPSNIFSNKRHFAVMFASNCRFISNRRIKYVAELEQYISVDVFGNCGRRPPCMNATSIRQCIQRVVRKYKFYLAFENSNCRDYITEKFFDNALKNNVIPVVMGAHKDDYRKMAPPNSFIHIDDFQSPKHLAEYLTALSKNSSLYNNYFQWQGTGMFYNSMSDLFCRVCGMLFYHDYVRPHPWSQNTSWASVDNCLPRGSWYWENHN